MPMKDTMQAAVFEGKGTLSVREVPVPKIVRPTDVLLKVRAAAICGTDVSIVAVPPRHPASAGVVLGHEFTGEVIDVGPDVTHLVIGDTVVASNSIPCGVCPYCRLGAPGQCENMEVYGVYLNGCFAEYVVLPAKGIHKISSTVALEEAVVTEPLACIMHAVRRLQVTPGENVAILGGGPIGLVFTQVMKAAGAGKVIVAEPFEYRQKFAKLSGADLVVDPRSGGLPDAVMEMTKIGADVVIDTVGTLLEDAIHLARHDGRIALFGVNQSHIGSIKQSDITFNNLTVMGTFIDNFSWYPAVRLIESGRLNLSLLVTHKMPLSSIHEGMELMRRGECIKVVLVP